MQSHVMIKSDQKHNAEIKIIVNISHHLRETVADVEHFERLSKCLFKKSLFETGWNLAKNL